jgi:hypothetical protein
MATFPIQAITENEPAPGRGVDFKIETSLSISCTW